MESEIFHMTVSGPLGLYFQFYLTYNQQDATFLDLFISTDALHVSGGSSAHHQEHTAVNTAFRYCQPIMLLPATVVEVVPPHPH